MSKWVPKPGISVDLSNRPTIIPSDKIESIIEAFPDVTPLDEEFNKLLRSQFQEWLRNELKSLELCPSEIAHLGQQLNNRFEYAKIEPGTPVGSGSAEGTGASNTQGVLSSFKEAGKSKNVGSTTGALKDILHVLQKRPKSFVYFNSSVLGEENATYHQAMELGLPLVEVTVGNIVKDAEVDDRDSLDIDNAWWYPLFLDLFPYRGGSKREIPSGTMILRLYLRTALMYEHRISINDVVQILESEVPESGIICVASPQNIGIIDIYPSNSYKRVVKDIKGVPETVNIMYFFNNEVLPLLDKISIKGIPGIKRIYPVSTPIWSVTMQEKRLTREALESALRETSESEAQTIRASFGLLDENPNDDFKRSYVVQQNLRLMKVNGITYDDILNLLEMVDIERPLIYNFDVGYIIITLPESSKVLNKEGKEEYLFPSKYIEKVINEEEEERKKSSEVVRVAENNPYYEDPVGPKKRASEFYYLETEDDGKEHLVDLWALDYINPDMTITNNFLEVRKLLGIEAQRQIYIRELITAIRASAGNLPPSLYLLVIDAIFHFETATGIAFWGSRMQKGFMSELAQERPMHVLMHHGTAGTQESRSVTASISLGNPPYKLGTQLPSLVMTPEEQKRLLSGIIDIKNAGITLDPRLVQEYMNKNKESSLEGEVTFDEATVLQHTMEVGENITGEGLKSEKEEKVNISKLQAGTNFPIMSITTNPFLEGAAQKTGVEALASLINRERYRIYLLDHGATQAQASEAIQPLTFKEYALYEKRVNSKEVSIADYAKWLEERKYSDQVIAREVAAAQPPSFSTYTSLKRNATIEDYRQWLREIGYGEIDIALTLGEEPPLPIPSVETEVEPVIALPKEMRTSTIKASIKPEPAVSPELMDVLNELRINVPAIPGISPATITPIEGVHTMRRKGELISKGEANELQPLKGGSLPDWIVELLKPLEASTTILPKVILPSGIQLPDYSGLILPRKLPSLVEEKPKRVDLSKLQSFLS